MPTMAKITSPRSAAKRAAILDAAQDCFLDHGYANTSMDMVAARASVSKATIYAHFASKDVLFGAIIRRRCEDQSRGLGAVSPGDADTRTALTAIARHLTGMLMAPEVVEIYRLVVAESPRHPDLAQVYYEQGPARGKQAITDALAQLSARGELAVPDPWKATDLFINMLRGEVFHRILLGLPPSDRLTLDDTIAEAVEVMMRAYGVRG